LFVCSRQYPQTPIFKRGVIQVDAYVQHWHDLLSQKEIAGTIGMPAHLRKVAFRHPDVMVQDQSVLLVFADAALIRIEEAYEAPNAGILQHLVQRLAVEREKAHALDHLVTILILAEFQGNAIDLVAAFLQPLLFNAVKLFYK